MDSTQLISPVLLQRQCDGGKANVTKEQWAEIVAQRLRGEQVGYLGCGTWFQWYLGSSVCTCPTCGCVFAINLPDIEKFRVLSTLDMMKERDMEERILRNVLARIGK